MIDERTSNVEQRRDNDSVRVGSRCMCQFFIGENKSGYRRRHNEN